MDSGGKLLAILLVLGAALGGVGTVILFDQVDHIALLFFLPLMILIGLLPIVAKVRKGTFDLFEVTIPYFAMYFLFYGAGALFMLFVDGAALDAGVLGYLDLALGYCTLGFGCAIAGYSLAGRIIPAYPPGRSPRMGWMTLFVVFNVGYLGEVIRANLEYIPMGREINSSGMVTLLGNLSFLTMFAMFYVIYLLLSWQGTLVLRLLLFAWMVPLEVLALFLRFGNKTALMFMMGLPLIAYWYARRRVPWKSLIVTTLLVVFIVFPVYYTYRTVRGQYYSRELRVARSIELLQKQEAGSYAQDSLKTVARRFAIINSTAVVVRDCGTRVEYEMGKSLWDGIVQLAIPRIFWPNKPTTNVCTEFGKIFRMTGFGNFSAVSMSMVGELYWQFHVPGIIAGMLLMGLWMRVLYARFAVPESNPMRLAIYVPLMYATITAGEGDIGGLIGVVGRMLFVYFVIEKGLLLMQGVGERRSTGQSDTEAVTVP